MIIQFWVFILVCSTIFIIPENRLQYWLPGNSISLYITFLLIFSEFFYNNKIYKDLKFPKSKKRDIHNQFISASREDKQGIYVNFVKEIKKQYEKRESLFTKHNSFIIIAILFIVTFISFFYIFYLEISYGYFEKYTTALSEQILEKVKITQEKYPDIYNSNTININTETLKFQFMKIKEYSFFLSFLLSFIVLYITSFLVKKVSFAKKNYYYPIFSLTNFSLPIIFFWVFMVLLITFWLSYKIQTPSSVQLVIQNLLFVWIFLYIINGYSIIKLYGRIRLISIHNISLIILLISFIMQIKLVYSFIAVTYLLIGIGDVWLGLRKKALQPKFIF